MEQEQVPQCTHCGGEMKKWAVPANSTWTCEYLWVCFNDECPYFSRGWEHMMETQNVKASYRHTVNPETGTTGPLPTWSVEAHKDRIIEE